MKSITLYLMLVSALSCWAQVQTKTGEFDRAPYSYAQYAAPSGMKVRTPDKQLKTLEFEGVTLVHVWSRQVGTGFGDPWWDVALDMAKRCAQAGARFISVNFENGLSIPKQHEMLNSSITLVGMPKEVYLDFYGYVVDELKVPHFPRLYLIDAGGNVIFSTRGDHEEGMAILNSELDRLLKGA